ncbi:hypothetical protein HYS97_03630 [Candidatus Daviesbacteria bacterium]|nr:hypothetical protein [Candidatus Daviesbacteria bacterium]
MLTKIFLLIPVLINITFFKENFPSSNLIELVYADDDTGGDVHSNIEIYTPGEP